MPDMDELRERVARVLHDENERLRSENGTRHTPLRWDELRDEGRKNRQDLAQAVIDDLGLHYVYSEEYARVGLDWLNDGEGELVEKGRHVVGRWEPEGKP